MKFENVSFPEMAAHISGGIQSDEIRRLWSVVLLQAVQDALAPKPEFIERDWESIAKGRGGAKFDGIPEKERAHVVRSEYRANHRKNLTLWRIDRDYIGGSSFREVCFLCGLDPDAVEQRVKRQMEKTA